MKKKKRIMKWKGGLRQDAAQKADKPNDKRAPAAV